MARRRRKPAPDAPNGWLVIDKPSGMTSTAVSNAIKRISLGAKCGHGGTLDPLATGCLPFASNGLTTLIPFVPKLPKIYQDKSYMIIDGKFLCLDPFLGTKYHLLSSNKYSKIEIVKGLYPIFKSKKLKLVNKGLIKDLRLSRFKKIIKHGKLFFKFINKAKYIGSYYLIRTIETNKEKTDERLNRIDFINNKIITLFSGKWNTSVSVGFELLRKIK